MPGPQVEPLKANAIGKYNYPGTFQFFNFGFVEPSISFCVSITLITTKKNHIWKIKESGIETHQSNPLFLIHYDSNLAPRTDKLKQ